MMDVSLRRVIMVLDTYTDNKKNKDHGVHIKLNLEELQYVIKVVKTIQFKQEILRPNSYSVFDHKDVLFDYIGQDQDFSKLKMKSKKKDQMFPEITPTMMPSIQSAVEHFRKTMSRPKGSSVHLPSLSRSVDGVQHPGRIKYKHRSVEETTRNSENWDRLRDVLNDENNSIDVVYEANKPDKSHVQSLECSPPLVSLSMSDGINLDKEKDLKSKEVENREELTEEIINDEAKANETHLTGKYSTGPNNDPEEKYDRNRNNENKIKDTNLPPKALLISVPTVEKSTKKKVRFNLDQDIHKKTYVNALKTARMKEKRHSLTHSYKFSYFNHSNDTSKKAKVRSEMKQIFRGQHPDKYYRSQKC